VLPVADDLFKAQKYDIRFYLFQLSAAWQFFLNFMEIKSVMHLTANRPVFDLIKFFTTNALHFLKTKS
jgi:hypothetical protein